MIFSTPEETPLTVWAAITWKPGTGSGQGKVTYDRKHSAITEYDFSHYDFERLLEGYTWLHLSGITPALGEGCREMILTCLKIARKKE